MNVPVILSLETATRGGSVWLGQGTVELATRIGDAEVSQSTSLLTDISESLLEAGVKLADVDLFACASGPGSFTGLRIGIATLKALAASLSRPCIGIPTLHAVAHAAGPSCATVVLLPAGRGEGFAQMFSVSEDGAVLWIPLRTYHRKGSLRDTLISGMSGGPASARTCSEASSGAMRKRRTFSSLKT
jgi:tRNA threonylcarbamoyladenosine biosynthesis protein TsaB